MDGERYIQRSSWQEDEPQPRGPRGRYKPRSVLSEAQDRWLLKAWKLRQRLTDKAIAQHLGITVAQLQHQTRRVRGVR